MCMRKIFQRYTYMKAADFCIGESLIWGWKNCMA